MSHTKHNSQAEFDNGLGGKRERHRSHPVIHVHTKHNSLAKVDIRYEGKGERHWSLPVIHAHTKHNSQAKLIQMYIIRRKRGEVLVTSSHTHTHITQLTN